MADIAKLGFTNGTAEGKWYEVPNNSEFQVRISILTPAKRREFTKLCTRTTVRNGRQMELQDEERLNRLMLDEVIVDWNFEQDGQKVEVNIDSKVHFDDVWPEFSMLWNRVVKDQNAIDEEIREIEVKN